MDDISDDGLVEGCRWGCRRIKGEEGIRRLQGTGGRDEGEERKPFLSQARPCH